MAVRVRLLAAILRVLFGKEIQGSCFPFYGGINSISGFPVASQFWIYDRVFPSMFILIFGVLAHVCRDQAMIQLSVNGKLKS